MAINVIITGATGMVGKGVLLECLESDDVASVLSISRRSVGLKHAKMREAIVSDVSNLDHIDADLTSADACFFGLGVSSAGMSEADYRKITYDLTLDFATALAALRPDMTFCYVSGSGTNANSKTMWARVKGETEAALAALPFKAAVMFRPGLIQPMKGVKPTSRLFSVMLTVLGFVFPLMRAVAPNSVTTTSAIGKAFIKAARNGADKSILDPADINHLGR
jgi:uncharacterized protein YbjT (DUF2867 family)